MCTGQGRLPTLPTSPGINKLATTITALVRHFWACTWCICHECMHDLRVSMSILPVATGITAHWLHTMLTRSTVCPCMQWKGDTTDGSVMMISTMALWCFFQYAPLVFVADSVARQVDYSNSNSKWAINSLLCNLVVKSSFHPLPLLDFVQGCWCTCICMISHSCRLLLGGQHGVLGSMQSYAGGSGLWFVKVMLCVQMHSVHHKVLLVNGASSSISWRHLKQHLPHVLHARLSCLL